MMISQINQFGLLAPVVAFMLFVLQAIFPVFPYFVLSAAGGMLFGFKLGFLIAWLGALTGACLAFFLCRWLEQTALMQRWYPLVDHHIQPIDKSTAFWSIVLARVIPLVPTPVINITAAIGRVSFATFIFSSALGKLPSALLYTGLGLALVNARDVRLTLYIIGAIIIILWGLRYRAQKKQYPRRDCILPTIWS